MSLDQLVYLIAVETAERESLAQYFQKHQFNIQVFDSLDDARAAAKANPPELFVMAGSSIPSPEICRFGADVEAVCTAPIIVLLTKLQTTIVSEMAASENLWTAEYPISLREIRASVTEALQEISQT